MTPDEFINRMLVLYGAPDTPDTKLFFDEYRAVIGKTTPRVLQVAASIIRDEHEFKSWPVPAVVRKAIGSAALRVNGPARPAEASHQQNPRANPSPESRKRVADIVETAVKAMHEEVSGKPKFPFVEVQRPSFVMMQRMSVGNLHRKPYSRNARGA